MTFRLSEPLAAVSDTVAEGPVSQVRLVRDARWPWLMLVPRVAGAVEMEDLSPDRRAAVMEEAVRAGRVVRRLAEALDRPVDKLNLAALGNVTPQLHVHIVGRRRDDPAWPDPVWAHGAPVLRAPEDTTRLLALAREAWNAAR